MINGQRVIAVIPARGGSKGVYKKNIRNLDGKPLLAWSIEVAQRITKIDRVIVSTDDNDIALISEKYDAEVFKRPKHLAMDDSLVSETIKDLIITLGKEGERVDIMVLLEPTCPFRSSGDIEKCLRFLTDSNEKYDSVATFKEAVLNPHRAWKITANKPEVFIKNAIPWLPRQKLPKAYQLDGGVYVFFTHKLPNNGDVLFGQMGAVIEKNKNSVDIDSEIDFTLAEAVLKSQKN